jgi:hypothetical protein
MANEEKGEGRQADPEEIRKNRFLISTLITPFLPVPQPLTIKTHQTFPKRFLSPTRAGALNLDSQ